MSCPSVGATRSGARSSNSAPAINAGSRCDAGDVPDRIVPMAGELRQRTGVGERLQVAAIELRAVRKIGHARERHLRPRCDDPLRSRFGESGDHAKTETKGRAVQSPGFGGRRDRCLARAKQTLGLPLSRERRRTVVVVPVPAFAGIDSAGTQCLSILLQRAIPIADRDVDRRAPRRRDGARRRRAAPARRSPSAASSAAQPVNAAG